MKNVFKISLTFTKFTTCLLDASCNTDYFETIHIYFGLTEISMQYKVKLMIQKVHVIA